MKIPSSSEQDKIILEELKAKLLIFQAKAANNALGALVQANFAEKVRKIQIRISRLKALMGDSEHAAYPSPAKTRSSDGYP